MLKYSDVETFTREALTDLGYGALNPDVAETARTMPRFDPGPFSIESIQKRSPQATLFLQIGNGVGLTTEAAYDRTFITVRAIGMQNDYSYAETLAQDVDDLLLAVASPRLLGETRVLYVTRTGGAPQLVDFDSANRYHFQSTYITEAKR